MNIGISGIGAVTGYGIGTEALANGMRSGLSAIHALGPDEMPLMTSLRVGSSCFPIDPDQAYQEIVSNCPGVATIAAPVLRTAGKGLLAMLVAASQAVAGDLVPETGVVVAGSNLFGSANAGAELAQNAGRRPPVRHAVEMFDSHAVAVLSAVFSLRGPGFGVGAASASGIAALVAAIDMLRAGRTKRCLVVAVPTDFGAAGWAGLDLIGALADGRSDATALCCPFDKDASGFVPGECSAAILLSTEDSAIQITGSAIALDATSQPTPSKEAEVAVIRRALAQAQVAPGDLDLISAHASSTPLGDLVEAQALSEVLGDSVGQVPVNAPKGLIGHGLAVAGLVETVACVLQMRQGFLHPNLELHAPVAPLNYVGKNPVFQSVRQVLKPAFGFGGFNAAIVLETTL